MDTEGSLLLAVRRAVQYSHSHSFLFRDIVVSKNIMICDFVISKCWHVDDLFSTITMRSAKFVYSSLDLG